MATNIEMVFSSKSPERLDGGILLEDDGESWRSERLAHVVSYISGAKTRRPVVLHDHEGHLSVFWLFRPDEQDMKTIEEGWNRQAEHAIEHFLLTFHYAQCKVEPL